MTKNKNKTGAKVFEAKKGTVCINPYAYNALAVDMKAECSIMTLTKLGDWFDAWIERSGYTREDFSVCFSPKVRGGSPDIIISFDLYKFKNCFSASYAGLNTFIIKLDVLGFLLIPDMVLGWVSEFLHDSLSQIKSVVGLSVYKDPYYHIDFCTDICGDPFTAIRYDSDIDTDCDTVGSLVHICLDGFHFLVAELGEKDPDRHAINKFLTQFGSWYKE